MRTENVTSAALVAALSVVGFSAMSGDATAQETRTNEQPVVYGQDDRAEVPTFSDEAIRTLAEQSIVTLVAKPVLDPDSAGNISFRSGTLADSQNLCAGERFADQPSAGFCSGTLIGPDLVLTAGHCFGNGQASCAQIFAVFNYQWTGSGLDTVTTSDVFACERLLVREQSESGGQKRDYAIFQLERPATQYTPANVAPQRPNLSAGDPFVLIGSPSGIPVKIDTGGVVREPRASSGDFFVGTPDTFGGNSGSGVFLDGSLDLFGVLVEGDTDYIEDNGCQRVNVCSESGCGGENILYARMAIDDLCTVATDEALCGTSSTCGDGYCAYDEDPTSCAGDCVSETCGDNICTLAEWNGCPSDCEVQVPAGWTCDASYYGTLDGCDCECGAYDPDCDLGQQVLNCGFGQSCSEAGTCEGDLASLCEGCAATPENTRLGVIGTGLVLLGLFAVRRRRVAA